MVVGIMHLLHARPFLGITRRRRKLRNQLRPPFLFISLVKFSRVKGPQCIAADSIDIFEDQTDLRLECQIRPDVNPPQRIRIIAIKPLAVRAVVAGLEADVVRTFFIPTCGRTNRAGTHLAQLYQKRTPGGGLPGSVKCPKNPSHQTGTKLQKNSSSAACVSNCSEKISESPLTCGSLLLA